LGYLDTKKPAKALLRRFAFLRLSETYTLKISWREILGRVGSGRVGSGRVGSGRGWSGLVGAGRGWSGLVGSGLVGSGLVGAGRVGSGLVGSGRAQHAENSGKFEFPYITRAGAHLSVWRG
jgi:hypothetical protein